MVVEEERKMGQQQPETAGDGVSVSQSRPGAGSVRGLRGAWRVACTVSKHRVFPACMLYRVSIVCLSHHALSTGVSVACGCGRLCGGSTQQPFSHSLTLFGLALLRTGVATRERRSEVSFRK